MISSFDSFSLKDWLAFGDSCHWKLSLPHWALITNAIKQDFSKHLNPLYRDVHLGVILVQQRHDFFTLLARHSFDLSALRWADIRSYSVALNGHHPVYFSEYGIPFGGYEGNSHYMCISLGLSPRFGGWSGQRQVIENISHMQMDAHEKAFFLNEVLSNSIDASKHCSSVSNRELIHFIFSCEARLGLPTHTICEHIASRFNRMTDEIASHVDKCKTKPAIPDTAFLQRLLVALRQRQPQCDAFQSAFKALQHLEAKALFFGCTLTPTPTLNLLNRTIQTTIETVSAIASRFKRRFSF
jgi:hypothetical protein